MASALGAQARRLAMAARGRTLESASARSLVPPRCSFSSRAAAASPPRHLPASAVTSALGAQARRLAMDARGRELSPAAASSLVPARRSFSSRPVYASADDAVFWLTIIGFGGGGFIFLRKKYLEKMARLRKAKLKVEFLTGVLREQDEEIANLKRKLAAARKRARSTRV